MDKAKKKNDLIIQPEKLFIEKTEMETCKEELSMAKQEIATEHAENEKKETELLLANTEIAFQNDEKEKREAELIVAKKELRYQNKKKGKKAAALVVANKELVFQNTEKEKRADEAEKSKQVLEEKNKDITDSINYAKRIQQAQLPTKQEILSALPNCFVLYKPKDIVSGDFYFFHKNNQSLYIAAADCTGHGVPGALMSMIGSEKLSDAVAVCGDISEILTRVNKGIKTSLRQSACYESTKDGMDIALCSISTDDYLIKYSGANRPIWIIRKGATEVEEIKGTKKSIGGFTEDNQHFKCHEIQLKQGDSFYIFSDGYADTFGGLNGKKMKTKKFKQLLLDIQYKTMEEQERFLDEYVETWKAGIEQVDDILVIGVRL